MRAIPIQHTVSSPPPKTNAPNNVGAMLVINEVLLTPHVVPKAFYFTEKVTGGRVIFGAQILELF